MSKIIIASGPVIVEEGRVLLNKHGDTAFWKFCGGKAETLDISLIEVARREVKEEMGLDIEILDEQPFLFFTTKKTETDSFDVVLVHYLAKRVNEIQPGADIREWKWIDLKELPNDLGPNIIPALTHFGFVK